MAKPTLYLLNGEWHAEQQNGEVRVPSRVPGCIHLDLQRAGAIPDPFYRDQEKAVAWVGESDWVFTREFEAPPEMREREHLVLQCEGLDTLAEVRLNGELLGRADNMFRCWIFPVKDHLREGVNTIEIAFRSPVPLGAGLQKECFLKHSGIGHHRINGSNWFRKEQCNFGWDWGPMLPTCGIWRPILLAAWDTARLGDTRVEQQHHSGRVRLHCQTETEGGDSSLQVTYSLRDAEGAEVAAGKASCGTPAVLEVADPRLWWPRGLGDQPLYRLEVRLHGADEALLDQRTLRLGLRSVELIQEDDAWGQSFTFAVNGHRFFAKGANWIPAHVFDGAVDRAKLEDLVLCAAEAHMNMLRVWGGGIYESEDFYDLCDEHGLLVWQDFMFACSAYPAHEPAFLENVREEVIQQVNRLQHRACLALWCGNNEIEQLRGLIGEERAAGAMSWDDYRALFDDLIGGEVGRLDPGRTYIPSSEYSPVGDRKDSGNPNCGDAHLWAVWHGREPFEWYRGAMHRFCSEFGFQSFPHPETVRSYTRPEERNMTSYVMEHHQRSPIGNSAIIDYLLSWFRLPVGWEQTVWLSQVVQAYAIKYAVEHWRRHMPRCMGALYWQLNDCWPVASWASLDSAHHWKALHYEARRFFEPTHLSLLEDLEQGEIEIHLSNDRRETVQGEWELVLTDLDGSVIGSWSGPGRLAAGSCARLTVVSWSEAMGGRSPREVLLWGEWRESGQIVSRNMTTLARPKHLELRDPQLTVSRTGGELVVNAARPALFVWLQPEDPDARFSENFFHLRGGEERRVKVVSGDAGENTAARSLFDTYQEE